MSCRMQLKSESRSKRKERAAAQRLPAKSPGQTARRWTRTHRGTHHPTAQERTQQAQAPAHHTGISSQKERNGRTPLTVCFFLFNFFYWVLPDAVSALFWTCVARLVSTASFDDSAELWTARGTGTAKFNKHIRMNVCYEDVCENWFVRTLLMQCKSP